MMQIIRSELYKALRNKMLYIAIGIGTLFCAMDVIENILYMGEFIESIQWAASSGLRMGSGHEGYSLFYLWMGLTRHTYGANLYATVWPILAAMAYGWSYNEERRSGIYNQIVSRSNAWNYYVAKYISVFLSGGLAVSVPLLLNLLSNALVCPYAEISPSFAVLSNIDFLSELYYRCPWIYGLIWCGVVFLLGGGTACVCFSVGTMLRYSVMVMLVPFVLYVFGDAAITTLRPALFPDLNLQPSFLRLINSSPGFPIQEWFLFTALAVLIAGSFTIGYWQVTKHELV